jgi:hypothetical protein
VTFWSGQEQKLSLKKVVCTDPSTTFSNKQKQMAAAKVFDAVANLVVQCNDEFLQRVAVDYNLDVTELRGKYSDVVKVVSEPKKRKAVVSVVDEEGREVKKAKGDRASCQGITAKKEPCKFSALKGGCFCLRHQKAHDESKAPSSEPKPKAVKPVKPAPTQPMHSHAPDAEVHADCELCQSHGPVFGGVFEVEEAPLAAPLEDRLRNLIEQAGEAPDESEAPEAPEETVDERSGPFQEEEFSDAEFPADD